jgi:hypothetical protein
MALFHDATLCQQAIGVRLRTLMASVVDEPPPADFCEILQRADRAGTRRAPGRLAQRRPAPAAAPRGRPAVGGEAASEPDLETIGRLVHETNRVWAELNGDCSQTPWPDAPEWQRSSTMASVRFFREHPDADDSAMHQAWLDDKRRAGWTYGQVKDPERKQHPCMVPFAQLPPEQQFKDRLLRTVVAMGLKGARLLP